MARLFSFVLLTTFFLVTPQAYACPDGMAVFSGDCMYLEEIPETPFDRLHYYGDVSDDVGDQADLFVPGTVFYAAADIDSKVVYTYEEWSSHIELSARIDRKIAGGFYQVTIDFYDDPTSCGIGEDAKVKKSVTAYVPRFSKEGWASLWQFQHMTGLC